MLDYIEELAGKRPPSERLEAMLSDVRRRREMLRLLNPMSGLLGGFGFGADDCDDDEFYEDDDDEGGW